MSTKAGKPAAPKKESSKKPAATKEKKVKETVIEVIQTESEEVTIIDTDELEENEDAAAAAAANAGGGNAAALAAAAGNPTEMSASFKNFRHHPDMENFYRFIYENDLRHEALAIIDEIMVEKQQRKLLKGAKAQAH